VTKGNNARFMSANNEFTEDIRVRVPEWMRAAFKRLQKRKTKKEAELVREALIEYLAKQGETAEAAAAGSLNEPVTPYNANRETDEIASKAGQSAVAAVEKASSLNPLEAAERAFEKSAAPAPSKPEPPNPVPPIGRASRAVGSRPAPPRSASRGHASHNLPPRNPPPTTRRGGASTRSKKHS
jgi:hypothetical protein